MKNPLVLHENQDVTFLQNHDIVPMPLPRRKWGFFPFLSFFSLANISVSTWSAGGAMLPIGLNVKELMGAIVVGNLLISLAYIGTSGPGSDFHVGYTVYQRLLFGIKGSYLGVLIRIILSVVWYGTMAWMGGLLLGNIFSSWSNNYLNLSNTFPESVPFSRKDLISFVLFQLISLPFFLIKPENMKFLLHIGCVTCFFSMLGLTCWAVVANGHSDGPLMSAPIELTSSQHGWAWISAVTGWYGSLLTGIVNSMDYTRFSTHPTASWGGIVLGNLVMGTIIPLMGLVTASALQGKYPNDPQYWYPSQILDKILTDTYTSKARAGVFFCAFGILLSQLAVNITGNGVSGGTDMAGMLPKYINIKRGAIITALLSWCACPWLYYNSASKFFTVMGAFSVFLSPLAGIIICEHWVKRKRLIKLSDLYTFSESGSYYYTGGVHWWNMISWVIGFAPGLPGLIASANTHVYSNVNGGIMNYYNGNSLFGFCIGFFLCYIGGFVIKVDNTLDEYDQYDTFTEEEAEKLGIMPYKLDQVPYLK